MALREGTPEEAGFDPDGIVRLRERAAAWAALPTTQGLVLLVARHGVVCLHEAWGRRTFRADSPPMTTDSLFWSGSLAKPVTAVAAMMLAEEGLLSLSRPVRHYVPELAGAGTDAMLVTHLFTHTSGYDGDTLPGAIAAWLAESREFPECPPTQHPRVHRRLCALYAQDLAHPAGTLMSYSTENYQLLGEVIRRVSGMAFTDFVRERLFEPLGMDDSEFGLTPEREPRFALRGPDPPDRSVLGGEAAYRWTVQTPLAGASLLTTADDYAQFAQMLLDRGAHGSRRVLEPTTVAQMTRNQIPGIPTVGIWGGGTHPESDWGLGFDIQGEHRWRGVDGSLTPVGCFGHTGAGGLGFWVDPMHDLLGIYFSVSDFTEDGEQAWAYDLFQNLVTAAIADDS